jgi:hypothetical protein
MVELALQEVEVLMTKVYTKDHVKELMLAHYPVPTKDAHFYTYIYCNCGAFLDYHKNYPEHVDKVLRRTKGD